MTLNFRFLTLMFSLENKLLSNRKYINGKNEKNDK